MLSAWPREPAPMIRMRGGVAIAVPGSLYRKAGGELVWKLGGAWRSLKVLGRRNDGIRVLCNHARDSLRVVTTRGPICTLRQGKACFKVSYPGLVIGGVRIGEMGLFWPD
jgi:hypothetical protein